MKSISNFTLVALILIWTCGVVLAEDKDKVEVICHYMTWFKYRTNANKKLEISHWKWSGKNAAHDPRKSFNSKTRDVYSRFYPRIGIYDSGDPLVSDYHILTAKAAGISTLIIDWYKPGSVSDIAFQSLLERCEELNMKIAICYEEKTCFPDWNKISSREQAVAKAVKDFTYMKKYFSRKGYWKRKDIPMVLVFAGWGDWDKGKKFFTATEWDKILVESKTSPWIILQNYKKDYSNIKAGFSWLGNQAYTKWFYKAGDALVKKGAIDFYIGSVCPGFDDRGTWGWNSKPRFEAYLGLENFDRYLKNFDNSGGKIIQLVTWNDFAEGTMIEPTVQFGNIYLNRIGEWSAKRNKRKFSKINTLLPYKWFYLAKHLGQKNPVISQIRLLLANENYTQAKELIDRISAEQKIIIPLYISYNKEFKAYTVKTNNAEKKTVGVIRWQGDSFLKAVGKNKFALKGRNYGAVTEVRSHGLDEELTVEITELSNGTSCKIQLMMFDKKHKFLGSLDIKTTKSPAVINIRRSQINNKLKPDTAKTAIKIWLEGKPGSIIKLK